MSYPSQKPVRIRVLFFGAARDVVSANELELSLDSPATVATAIENLASRFPDLQRFGRSLLFAVNQEYASQDKRLNEDDELAVFPPVSGGSESEEPGRRKEMERTINAETEKASSMVQPPVQDSMGQHDFFEITTHSLDVGAIARRVVLPECGATVTLDGYAREWTAGRRTNYLVYEAYEPMALSEMRRLGIEAHERFAIAHIGIVHRTGRLEIGETSVVIAVGAPHRGAAFEACEWAIRELKRTVPIWKKEVFDDGEVWVEGDDSRTAQR